MNVLTNLVFLARQVEREPGFIVGPIAAIFGHVVNFLFNIVFAIGPANSLGFTIILMTIIFRACMMPLSIKAQKSMMRMRELKPELDKIQAKYGNSKDPEIVKKMNAEKQVLMQKHDANPLKGCFPMLLQMPLFIGLNFIMRQAFLYITYLRELYNDISVAIQQVPGYIELLWPIAEDLIPSRIIKNNEEVLHLMNRGYSFEAAREQVGDVISLSVPADLSRVISRFTSENWAWLQEQVPAYYWTIIGQLNEYRHSIETFFGLSMVEQSGWTWPYIVLPLLTVITMFCSQWVSQQRMADPNADEKVKMQQKMMLIIMPIFIGFITVGLPGGVALFWVTSQIFQLVQDLILNKKDGIPLKLPFSKKEY
ncbi:MAG: YidC/Oxa1 family membrane protein insertase [Firmicutes bacterium]|nr:YidC/Oxa1 family membrane protein insertase [Bacillota bacterium]